MGKLKSAAGVFKVMWESVKEDWASLDHKLLRIIAGVVGFAIAGLFWYLFLRNITPF